MNPKEIISKFHLPNPKWLMEALAASVEGLLHHTFGERYAGTLLGGLLVAVVVEFFSSIVPRDNRVDLMSVVIAALFARLIAHWVSVGKRRRAGIHVETRSSGSPWGFWSELRIPIKLTTVLLEPLLCFAVALLASPVDQVFSVWLCCAGLALMIKTIAERHKVHNGTLDILDARMAARNLRANVNQQMNQPAQTLASPVAISAATGNPQPTHPNPNHFRNLDPALQRLIHEDAPPGAPDAPSPAVSKVRVSPQQAARSADQPSGRERIHVRPSGVADSPAPTQATSTPPKPRVVIVRTRPAPNAPLRVSSSALPGTPEQTTILPVSSDVTQDTPASTPMSESAPQSNPTGMGARADLADGEHDLLRQRIHRQAAELGFEVKFGSSNTASSPIPDLILAKGEISLAVETVPNDTAIEHEFESVRKCLGSGFGRVAVVCENPDQLKALAASVHAGLTIEDAMKVGYFTPPEFGQEILRLATIADSACKPKRRL